MAPFLEMSAIESAVLRLRPELAERLRKPAAGQPLPAFDLRDHESVVVALVRGDASGAQEGACV
jgi:hypothetical protein